MDNGPSELGSHLASDGLARVTSMTTLVSGGSVRVISGSEVAGQSRPVRVSSGQVNPISSPALHVGSSFATPVSHNSLASTTSCSCSKLRLARHLSAICSTWHLTLSCSTLLHHFGINIFTPVRHPSHQLSDLYIHVKYTTVPISIPPYRKSLRVEHLSTTISHLRSTTHAF